MKSERPIVAITGAAEGIGWATARRFAEDGYVVVLVDIDAKRAAERADELGPDHIGLSCDVSKEEDVRRCCETIEIKFGRLDVLVNNAGVGSPHVPTVEQTIDSFSRVLDIHVKGTFLFCREAYRLMTLQKESAIVNVSSIAGLTGLPKRNAYGAAKAGISSMTKSLACEWAAAGIRVNAVAPGFTATALVKKLEAEGFLDAPKLSRRIPMGRLARPEEIADAIFYLASPRASYITGSVLSVDGGWVAFGDSGDASARD